jgi:hypothetical protein
VVGAPDHSTATNVFGAHVSSRRLTDCADGPRFGGLCRMAERNNPNNLKILMNRAPALTMWAAT